MDSTKDEQERHLKDHKSVSQMKLISKETSKVTSDFEVYMFDLQQFHAAPKSMFSTT